MKNFLIKNGTLVNEGKQTIADILIKNGRIEKIDRNISSTDAEVIDAEHNLVFPGVIDDQVHFREPGLTHKADIFTESRAAVAGGVTSFMEMPNTIPNTFTIDLLEQKFEIARRTSLANYSFFLGASNDNISEVVKADPRNVCGIKIFMGSSTGNMLVDNEKSLSEIFAHSPMLVATHCEDEATIRANTQEYKEKYGEDVPIEMHPLIRSAEACYKSSSLAVDLAKKHGTRLHVLHISTEKETSLFEAGNLSQKRITAEACIHHLWFSDEDYKTKGAFIKWNPAVKSATDREAVLGAVLEGRIDVIATDHAPHTLEEKSNKYFNCPSGGPLVQHSLVAMIELHKRGKISLEHIAEKMSHNPAILFNVRERGFIREGYFADLVIVNPNKKWKVEKRNILSKCGWSPFEGTEFSASVEQTFVNGHLAYSKGKLNDSSHGERLLFDRK